MGLVPFIDLLVQVGYAVLDTEDVHQFLREGPCNGSTRQASRRSALALMNHAGEEDGGGERTIAVGDRLASSRGRVRRLSCWP
jgi:hypothetical protein